MGSVMSFIVLCVVNGAVIRRAYEMTIGREVELSEVPAKVNGDDGAVKAPESFSSVWSDCASLVGLVPSQGKVYSHPEYLNMNSTSFILRNGRFVHVPYINMGLVKGLGRSQANGQPQDLNADMSRNGTIGSRHRDLFSGLYPLSIRPAVHKMFMTHNVLSGPYSKYSVPWFATESQGGLGLTPIVDYHLSDDLDESSFRLHELPSGAVLGLSDEDQDCILLNRREGHVKFQVPPRDVPLRVRSLWMSHLRARFPTVSKFLIDLSDENILDLSVYYFLPLHARYKVDSTRDYETCIRRNARAWALLRRANSKVSDL